MSNGLIKLLTAGNKKRLKDYRNTLNIINDMEFEVQTWTDIELRRQANALRERILRGESLDSVLPLAFALVREASYRTIGLRHFDVQLIGAMALNDGSIAEMKTGEGKTLVSTAAGFLNALSGENVHIVTVNDYLALRDSEWMGKVYRFFDMDVGLIQNGMLPIERQAAYRAAVTYGTNSEFGFDYLRDNMVSSACDRVQRGHHFAIVDEADSILIDEARTPLIISGLGGAPANMYRIFAQAVLNLESGKDFVLDEAKRTIFVTEAGLDKVESRIGFEIYTDMTGTLANHLKQALRAEYLFKQNIHYIIVEGELKIVDEFTGRIMEGRRYSEGLHQALEAKEHVEIKAENNTLATITLQNYFRLYEKLSGMTGTALTEDSEFRQIYHLPVIPIPPNKPVIRDDKEDLIFRTVEAKYHAVADEVERRHAVGQPVLIGTTSIAGSERLSALLDKRGVPHETLNAKNPEQEALIVSQAGRVGAVTIATNMAGRGTDILLGGNIEMLEREALERYHCGSKDAPAELAELAKAEAEYIVSREGYAVRMFGGLCVIGTERHESRRIDDQLRGRAGRQGDPGMSQFYLSLEDDLLCLFGKERLKSVADMMTKRKMPDTMPLQDNMVSKVIGAAQRQVESMHFASRKNLLEYDDVINLQRIAIYDERNAILNGKDVDDRIPQLISEVLDDALSQFCPAYIPIDDWDIDLMNAWVTSLTGRSDFSVRDVDGGADPIILQETLEEYLVNIYQEKREVVGEAVFKDLVSQIMLRLIDNHWISHLQEMDYIKAGIGLRAIGHRDPLVEYKEEAYEAFARLTKTIYEDLVSTLLHLPVDKPEDEIAPSENDNPFRLDKLSYSDSRGSLSESAATKAFVGIERKVL
ncbi:preprotein translocase subunit SecA [Gordonibacter urolithinfaciens]|uniref:preprotein translocase subunit SecA n=1 Tax=Gordonibacter urolithinfaciens TaxID=1335613 RepID=UPI000B36B407|nr:preprotein translocase subunit SecA [Gordonibacter urolithinfaciens]OUO86133.1 preprotein translocase subunit SecA [Gordonibacter urolithinfaciens]